MIKWLTDVDAVPHGYCLSWDYHLIMAIVLANGLIAVTYVAVFVALIMKSLEARPVLPRWVFRCYAAFIVCCGLSHAVDDVTLWYPVYRLQALVLAVTALASVVAAVLPASIWIARGTDHRSP